MNVLTSLGITESFKKRVQPWNDLNSLCRTHGRRDGHVERRIADVDRQVRRRIDALHRVVFGPESRRCCRSGLGTTSASASTNRRRRASLASVFGRQNAAWN